MDLLRFKKKISFRNLIANLITIVRHTKKLIEILDQHNVHIIYTNDQSAQLYGIILKLVTGKKLVWHVRDNQRFRFISFLFCLGSDKILCVSKHILNQIPFKNRAELVYNGINTDFWKPDSILNSRTKHKLGLDENVILIGHVGQIIPWKRHDLFLRIAQETVESGFENVHFLILGDDRFNEFPECLDYLVSMVESSGLNKYVTFLGYEADIRPWLQTIDIFLHLANNEPFGRIAIEAMAFEKPVICFAEGGPNEVVKNNASGYLIPSDKPSEVTEKLSFLISNSNLRREMGISGRNIVKANFSLGNLKRINAVMLEIYEEYFN
ncbi:MAG: glycosyltransferase family 1 protein [Flavobacterium sp.]|nr:MAG: glycosyltransferase family 1 protein [Flavobacterium sp.]